MEKCLKHAEALLGPIQPAPIGTHEPVKPEQTSMSTCHPKSPMLQRNEGSIEQPKVASPVICNTEQTLQKSTEVAKDLVSPETAQHPAFTLESHSTLSYPSLPFTPNMWNSIGQDDGEPILLEYDNLNATCRIHREYPVRSTAI